MKYVVQLMNMSVNSVDESMLYIMSVYNSCVNKSFFLLNTELYRVDLFRVVLDKFVIKP